MERKRQREGEGEGDMEEEDQRGNRAVTIRPGRRVSQALCVPLQGSWSPNPRNEPCRSPTLCPQQDTPSSLAPPSPPPLLLGKIPHTTPPGPASAAHRQQVSQGHREANGQGARAPEVAAPPVGGGQHAQHQLQSPDDLDAQALARVHARGQL